MNLRNFFGVLTVTIYSFFSFAHGEDKYGPHKGFVRMPGAFHTEVVLTGKNKVNVYLLDLDWKNPQVQKSSIEIKFNNEVGACHSKKNYFQCSFSKTINLNNSGTLTVKAIRNDQIGSEAVYNLPLKLTTENMKMEKTDHNMHH